MCAYQIRDFRHPLPRFSIIWVGNPAHRIRSTAFFIGGYSTPAFETGNRKLRRPSRGSSSEDFSKRSHLRMAKCFIMFLLVIWPPFSNRHHATRLLMQPVSYGISEGQPSLPRLSDPGLRSAETSSGRGTARRRKIIK